MNIFDRVLKVLAREYAAQFLALALPQLPLQVVGTLENVELALPEERVDFVHRAAWNGQEYVLHIEFQVEHKADTPRRLFIYSALLTKQLGLPILTVVFYLARQPASVPDAYEVQVGGVAVNRFEYPVVKLWEYTDEIAAGRWPELAPLLVMLVEGPPDTAVLARERELILQEPDSRKRASLLACAVTIGARYFDKTFLWRFFREEVEMMREATFIEDWLEDKLEEGLQQGLQQGSQKTRLVDVLRILGWRFGALPITLEERLARLTAEQLDPLVNQALDAPTLEAFVAAIG
jgi:predicted transposase YdaD